MAEVIGKVISMTSIVRTRDCPSLPGDFPKKQDHAPAGGELKGSLDKTRKLFFNVFTVKQAL
jgi:hypothetical protein